MRKTLFDELNEFAAEEQISTRIFKECEICGSSFEAKRKIRKYCDECQKNTALARYRMDAAIRRSKGAVESSKIVSVLKNCEYCNREFESTNGRIFCSNKCKQNYKIENNKCQYCGQLLYPKIKTIGKTMHPECKAIVIEKRAREAGKYRYCEYCNKEYLAKYDSQRFCSQDCNKAFRTKEVTKLTSYICSICNKEFIVPHNILFENEPNKAVCSEECKKQFKINEENRHRDQQKEFDAIAAQKRSEAELKKQQKYQKDIECYGLCGFCKTSYKDCELMESEFRVKPKGARYNGNGKIVECPKFTDKKTKRKKELK